MGELNNLTQIEPRLFLEVRVTISIFFELIVGDYKAHFQERRV
jgi:hypothetical protein